jgi:hypothetical protein
MTSRHHNKLDMTMSGIEPEALEAAEKGISEIQEEDTIPPPEVKAAELEDLKQTGVIATDFLSGMDKVSAVLMVLVQRFAKATNLMKIVLVAFGLGLLLFATALGVSYSINQKLGEVHRAVLEAQQSQQDILQRLDHVIQKAERAAEKADEARQQAEKAEEAAPKVVVDRDTGKPKLIVQSEGSVKVTGLVTPRSSKPAPVKRSVKPIAKSDPASEPEAESAPVEFDLY